jgi:hypothetical protein
MGGWHGGWCQKVGGEKLEECCKESGRLAEASEVLGSNRAVVPMMMMMMILLYLWQERKFLLAHF